jgi:NAD(P)-dependent dehydrogenase (short-subunit alcohol dehydrogenase family)
VRFEGKTAIVTGGTEGIGRAVAERLASENARLVVVARRNGPAEDLRSALGSDRVALVQGDVADARTAQRAVACALERFAGLDVLINNAALDHTGPLESTPESEIRGVFEVNVFGALFMLQAAGAAMLRNGGGAIVNLSSRLAEIGVPTMSVYAATKGAIRSLTRSAAVEWADRGVRVNAVAPGMTATPLAREYFAAQDDPAGFRREIEASIPQGRLGTPEEVAAAVAFLASDEARHITGSCLAIDGGYTAA